ncbi:GntR family transcriptional regulator [Reyranella sp.]|uniref:GntR family transcriptional regulator n=1 Tax=Reyranella sp. TaxID=1929291 RepID=UPI00122B0DE3|nr:GntR family transcriptional regulator [Reyranella sp.]TAJ83236.1 MAG: GntR family transcriptional regulator [Reyranella sp.]
MDGSSFPIARSSLPEAAAERLRTLIIEGGLQPGAKLNERELCERLGVSRTPLREAFRMLAADGLLVQLPNRGAQVVALSPDDVRDGFEVMAALEGLAGELAVARVTDNDIADLRALQAEMEAAHLQHDLPAYYRINRIIHDRLNAIAGNAVLGQTYRTLNARLHALRFRSNLNRAKWDQAVAEHRSMIAALAARDGAALRDLLIRHLRAKQQAVLASMNNQDSEIL